MYGGDSFLKGRPNFTEEAHSTEEAHFYGGDSAWYRRLSSTEEIYSTDDTYFYVDSFYTKEAHFYGGSFLCRRLIPTEGAHFNEGDSFPRRTLIFYGGDSFLRKYSFLQSRLVSKAETN